MKGLKNNMFKYATKELSQDAFLCWLINWKNTDNIKYSKIADNFINLIAEKIGSKKLKTYLSNNNYDVEIKHQYKNIDILLKIGDFYIIIEDKIKSAEHDDQINHYEYKLLKEGIESHQIYTCYYKIYDECNLGAKNEQLNAIITRRDMIEFLDKIEDKNMYIEDYYEYLLEIEKYSKIRDIKADLICNSESNIVRNIEDAIYTDFYSELEEKEKNIIGWNYADNRSGGTWWYASKKFNNVTSNDFKRIYAEINLKGNRNKIDIKLSKKTIEKLVSEDEKIDDIIPKDYLKFNDKYIIYKVDDNNKLAKMTDYIGYKETNNKVDIFNEVITDSLCEELTKKYKDIKIKNNHGNLYKIYARIASISINEYTLEEIQDILSIINKHLEKLDIKI